MAFWEKIIQALCTCFFSYQAGRLAKENEQLKKRNRKQHANLQVAARPSLSFSELVDWLQKGQS